VQKGQFGRVPSTNVRGEKYIQNSGRKWPQGRPRVKEGKVIPVKRKRKKISLLQTMESHRVARG
jgi:hypothetical protein